MVNTVNVIGGRGGAITALLGLFFYPFAAVFVAAFYVFALGIGALALLMAFTWKAYITRRRERKRTTPPAPPAPVMSRVR